MAVRLNLATSDVQAGDDHVEDAQLLVLNGTATVTKLRQHVLNKAGVVSIDAAPPQYRILFSDGTSWLATRKRGCGCGG